MDLILPFHNMPKQRKEQNMTKFTIVKDGEDEKLSDGTIVRENKYRVHPNDSPAALFFGTYTQCLIYIGARLMDKKHEIARNYATGLYR